MTLLYVDDDLEDIEIFHEAIKEIDEKAVCVTARNGRQGLDVLSTIVPDCIFLDINMPLMDGKETLRNIRRDKRFQSVPVFILSTSGNRDEMELCELLGATAFLTKPDNFGELVNRLKSVINKIAIL